MWPAAYYMSPELIEYLVRLAAKKDGGVYQVYLYWIVILLFVNEMKLINSIRINLLIRFWISLRYARKLHGILAAFLCSSPCRLLSMVRLLLFLFLCLFQSRLHNLFSLEKLSTCGAHLYSNPPNSIIVGSPFDLDGTSNTERKNQWFLCIIRNPTRKPYNNRYHNPIVFLTFLSWALSHKRTMGGLVRTVEHEQSCWSFPVPRAYRKFSYR